MKSLQQKSENGHLKEDVRVSTLKDYDDTYIYVKRVLVLIGIRLMREDPPKARRFWDIVYWIDFVLVMIPIILDCVAFKVILSEGSPEQVNLIFRTLPCMGYVSLALLKTYKMVYQRSVFENLIDELRDMWPQGVLSGEEQTVVSNALKEINLFVKAFYYCNILVGVSIVVPPYVDMLRRGLGHDIPRIMPFDYWLPFNGTQPVVFECTTSFMMVQAMLTLLCVTAGDLIFCVLISHITTQFDLLAVRIKKIFYVPIDHQLLSDFPLGKYDMEMLQEHKDYLQTLSNSELDDKYEDELKKIIKKYQALIRLANDLEDLFSFSFLINFFSSSIVICFCGYCSVMIEKWNEFMYKTFLTSVLIQTWLLCWYGQKLFESSGRVADSLYNSGWYIASKKIRRIMLTMICRSQRSSHITTYGFSIINLSTYTTIIKTSWSYFTLLLNMRP